MSTYEPEASGHDPGLDLHEWETQWQQLHDLAGDDPAQTLPELADLVEGTLRRRGFQTETNLDGAGGEPEVIRAYLFAREIGDRVERAEDGVGPGDVAAAYEALRDVHAWLTTNRRG